MSQTPLVPPLYPEVLFALTLQLTFDDGPSAGSDQLYTFLEQNNASSKATHFMIGYNILSK